jgi:hypothetical protein
MDRFIDAMVNSQGLIDNDSFSKNQNLLSEIEYTWLEFNLIKREATYAVFTGASGNMFVQYALEELALAFQIDLEAMAVDELYNFAAGLRIVNGTSTSVFFSCREDTRQAIVAFMEAAETGDLSILDEAFSGQLTCGTIRQRPFLMAIK